MPAGATRGVPAGAKPRVAKNLSIRLVSVAAAIASGTGADGACGKRGPPSVGTAADMIAVFTLKGAGLLTAAGRSYSSARLHFASVDQKMELDA